MSDSSQRSILELSSELSSSRGIRLVNAFAGDGKQSRPRGEEEREPGGEGEQGSSQLRVGVDGGTRGTSGIWWMGRGGVGWEERVVSASMQHALPF